MPQTVCMAKSKKKYYVVWAGRKPGVYDTWEACREQVFGHPGAKYKSFPTRQAAEAAYRSGPPPAETSNRARPTGRANSSPVIQKQAIAVDASSRGNPGIMEYRGVDLASGQEVFRVGPFDDGTNNIGEFLAIVHALALLEKQGKQDWVIYTDSHTALAWVRNRRVKTTLERTPRNEKLFELINRAIHWLQTHDYHNRILKWDTDRWGEIPADFGRK